MIPRKLLYPGEELVMRCRRHPRALAPAYWALVVFTLLGGALGGFMWRLADLGRVWPTVSWVGCAAVALAWLAALLRWVLAPLQRWGRTHINVTSQRFMLQRGRTIQQVPLTYIEAVWFKAAKHTLGAPGTLVLGTAQKRTSLHHIPDVEHFSQILQREVIHAHQVASELAWFQANPSQPYD